MTTDATPKNESMVAREEGALDIIDRCLQPDRKFSRSDYIVIEGAVRILREAVEALRVVREKAGPLATPPENDTKSAKPRKRKPK